MSSAMNQTCIVGMSTAFRVVWAPNEAMRSVRARFADFRAHPQFRFLKWQRVTGKMLYAPYPEFVKIFFEAAGTKEIRFRCIVVAQQEDPSRMSGGEELGFYKTYHFLLTCRLLPGGQYHVTLDRRSNKQTNRKEQLRSAGNDTLATRNPDNPAQLLSCKPEGCRNEDLQLASVPFDIWRYRPKGGITRPGAPAA